jgi:hypothetical protein
MNSRWLTIISDALILVGLILLWTGWHGSATITGAFPFHASSVQLTGGATGFHALLGVNSLLVGLGLMVIALIWTILECVHS